LIVRLPIYAVVCSVGFLALVFPMAAQEGPPSPSKSGAKLCVATVGNASTTSAFVERLTERLTKNLKQNKINAVGMDSRTTDKPPLEVSIENGDEAKQRECDYILLSQIRDPRQHPSEPLSQEISIGGRVPSIDASDSGSSGPVYRENLEVAVALFQMGQFKPLLDTIVLERPSKNVTDTLMAAMDREANRVDHELKKH
jgi:hypothetical protein